MILALAAALLTAPIRAVRRMIASEAVLTLTLALLLLQRLLRRLGLRLRRLSLLSEYASACSSRPCRRRRAASTVGPLARTTDVPRLEVPLQVELLIEEFNAAIVVHRAASSSCLERDHVQVVGGRAG